MKAFNIRAMPEYLHQKLKIKAAKEGKPMQTMILEILEKAVK